MAELFNAKNFNGEIFTKYVQQLESVKKKELLRSRAIVNRNDLAPMFSEQNGGNYATTIIAGRIGGTAQNYDGSTDITSSNINNYTMGRMVVGRAQSWTERDFTQDITGKDYMDVIGAQVADYWEDIDQQLILSALKGIFAMSTGDANKEFVAKHTYDISETASPMFALTTLNTALQRALGDNKSKFSLAIMHSAVATRLENLNLVEHLKYTDAQGVQRDLGLYSVNGKVVLVDDSMPVEEVPAVEANEGQGIAAADAYTKYTTYVLGAGAIEMTDCGVKTPHEMDRDPAKNGGETTLYSRQRKIYAPYGFTFKKPSGCVSPTDAQLENGTNWTLASSNENTAKFIPHKIIPIARIITRG